MSELEKAARMALEAISDLKGYRPDIDESIAALAQALATTEPATGRTIDGVLSAIDAATCPECGGMGVSDHGEPDSPDGPGRPAVDCKPCKGTGWRNGVHLSASKPATTERRGGPIGEIVRSFGTGSGLEVRLFGGLTSDTPGIIGTKLYTSPQVPEDVQRDAERYRWLRDKADYMRVPEGSPQVLMTDEFGSPISIYREAYPQGETLDAAIDAARKGGQ